MNIHDTNENSLMIECVACQDLIKVTSAKPLLCKGCLEAIKHVKTELETKQKGNNI